MDPAAWITETLAEHPLWVALTIALLAFVESLAVVGILVPGVALLFAAAVAAGGVELGIWITLGCAFAGAVAGDGISYLLGRRYAGGIRRWGPLARRPGLLASGERFFDRHGTWGIFIGRFVGPIRPVMPMVAGMLGMGAPRFFTVNLISAVAWAPVYILPGYLAGASLAGALAPPPFAIVGLLLLAFGTWALVRSCRWLWRQLERDGAWFQGLLPDQAWLWRPLSATDAVDTRACLLAVLGWTALVLGLVVAALLWLPALGGWRRFFSELWQLLLVLA